MDLYQLDCFRTVARMEHISNAAVVLHITQPALSKIISRVEDYAGAPLFDRVKGKIRLNESGKVFLGTLDEMFDLLDKSKRQVSELNTVDHNKIRLASSCDSILFMLAERFFSEHPDIRMWYSVLPLEKIQEGFMRGALDFALTTYPIQEKGIEWEPICSEEILMLCGDTSPFYGKKMVSFPQLQGTEIMCETQGEIRSKIFSCCEMAGYSPNVMLESAVGSTMGFATGLKRAVAFVPAHRVMQMMQAHKGERHHKDGVKISASRLQMPSCSWVIGLAKPAETEMNDNCQYFYDLVREYFSSLSVQMDEFMKSYFKGTF